MAAVLLDLDVTGLEALVADIAGLRKRLANLTPAYRVIANLLERHVAAQFSSQGKRLGNPWRPLAPSTVKARARRWGYYRRPSAAGVGSTRPILTWSARLRKSFRRGSPDHVRQVASSGLTWGSSVPYGIYHDSPAPRLGHLPRRQILGFANPIQEREILVRPIQLWVQGVPPGAIETVISARTALGL